MRIAGPAAAVVILVLAAGLSTTAAGSSAAWESFRLKARKMLFFTGVVDVDLERHETRYVLSTRVSARFMGALLGRIHTETRLDPRTGLPTEYRSRSGGSGRLFRFDESGYTVQKLEPAGDPDAPLEQWKVYDEARFEYPLDPATGRAEVVHDVYGWMLALTDAHLDEPGDEAHFWVATSDGPQSYRVRVAEVRARRLKVRDLRNGGKRDLRTHEVRLRILPDDPESAKEGFLQTEGQAELWIEPRQGMLIEVSGKVPKVPGRVRVHLDSIG